MYRRWEAAAIDQRAHNNKIQRLGPARIIETDNIEIDCVRAGLGLDRIDRPAPCSQAALTCATSGWRSGPIWLRRTTNSVRRCHVSRRVGSEAAGDCISVRAAVESLAPGSRRSRRRHCCRGPGGRSAHSAGASPLLEPCRMRSGCDLPAHRRSLPAAHERRFSYTGNANRSLLWRSPRAWCSSHMAEDAGFTSSARERRWPWRSG